ncbi:Sec-independent protein translocase protein TatB [Sinorhizobium meliloti]|uniref:Sec-independent protein translocase protein TatB n=1 Tax=Rhizobium meliloti TaxID=382 RepID=A0A6A7ZYK5_RHIML|nr:Sec-independent protein translocase protein TatB [Sinorhizobium meliloti]MDW9376388.1 twin-arginine translocase subunit TatB [Sinorhizobium meliloti]MDW9490575.1 twin-arginine translocase subunit TatB [Sinorhizobium meliloti]MDW9563350.1 twin-arginine translocase subunit TatB [Sinorhizobium meliloti]MDW9650586.1 twin-arginine translocase subunit TatB [Sinorhizobium meliloti]MDW9859716.1 twin-arginine translocase subunit TatB [Sinorhizobium meliloti]
MLDIGWTELVVIAIVLIIVVGPKDLPPMLRAFGRMTSKMRGMASDFRRQFDEALREADLDDVRKTISDAQSLNPTAALRDAMNPLRQLGNEIKSDLQKATTPDRPPASATPEPVNTDAVGETAAKATEKVAAAAVSSASRQMDRAADVPKASEPKPAPKPRAQSKKPGTSVTKKAAGETAPKKSPARKAPGEAPAANKSKTRAASRKKGDA